MHLVICTKVMLFIFWFLETKKIDDMILIQNPNLLLRINNIDEGA